MSKIDILHTSCEIALRWMPQDPADDVDIGLGNVEPDLCHHMLY